MEKKSDKSTIIAVLIILGVIGISALASALFGNKTDKKEQTEWEEDNNDTSLYSDYDSSETEDNVATTNNLTHDKKMEVLSYINGILDPLSETNMNDEQLEEKANEVWIDAEAKFQITENDIFDVMADMDLTKEYYTKIENESGEKITSYDAVLNSNNYGRIVVAKTKDGLTQYDKAMSANDNDKVSKLLFDGEIALLENDLKANILDFGIATTKVTVLEGLYKGYTGYIITEQVDRK